MGNFTYNVSENGELVLGNGFKSFRNATYIASHDLRIKVARIPGSVKELPNCCNQCAMLEKFIIDEGVTSCKKRK